MVMDLHALEIFLLAERKLAPATVTKTVQNIKRLESKDALTDSGFKNFTLQFLKGDLSKSYFNKYIQAVKWYCEFNRLEWGESISYFAEDEKVRDAFTDEEIEDFLALPPSKKQRLETFRSWVCFWNFCASTGCRPKEARSVKIEDIDLKNQIIAFRGTKTHLDREVPIGDRLYPILYSYLQSHPGNGFLFYYRDPLKELSDVSYLKDFHQRCERLGIKNRTPYSFRHSFGTRHQVDIETPLKVTMGLMGHKNPKTTLRYAHDSIKAKRKAIQRDPFQDSTVSVKDRVQQIIDLVHPVLMRDERFSWSYSENEIVIRVK